MTPRRRRVRSQVKLGISAQVSLTAIPSTASVHSLLVLKRKEEDQYHGGKEQASKRQEQHPEYRRFLRPSGRHCLRGWRGRDLVSRCPRHGRRSHGISRRGRWLRLGIRHRKLAVAPSGLECKAVLAWTHYRLSYDGNYENKRIEKMLKDIAHSLSGIRGFGVRAKQSRSYAPAAATAATGGGAPPTTSAYVAASPNFCTRKSTHAGV